MEEISVLISEEKLMERIKQLGEEISRDYEGKEIQLVCILKGGAPFACALAKRISVPVVMDFMQAASYGGSTMSSGDVKLVKDLDMPVEGKHVLIAEDIIDTGNTLAALTQLLAQRGAADVKICTLLDKPARRIHKKIEADYCGFSVPDSFVVGMGLDYDQRYRNLPYIGILSLS